MILPVLLTLVATSFHPDSLSTSKIVIDGTEAHLELRCQALSLMEVIPGLDRDGDDEVSTDEIAEREDEILAYVGEHYKLFTGTDRSFDGGTRLSVTPLHAVFVPDGPLQATGYRKGAVDLEYSFQSETPIEDLAIEMSLFLETSPAHIDYSTVTWRDGESATYVLDAQNPRVRLDPTGRGVFAAFVKLGVHHILSGWDHLAFVLALILSARGVRSILVMVTAFTAAHSLTLALSALDVINLSAQAQFIESAVALSIAYVAVENLLHPNLRRSRWIEAFFFGLLHGLAFASFLGGSLAAERAKGIALASFNVGVELGQLLVVVAVVLLLRFLPRGQDAEEPFLAPAWSRRLGSLVIAGLGFYWFIQRV